MIFYAYFGYPLVLLAIDAYRWIFIRKSDLSAYRTTLSQQTEDELPIASFIITAHNEEGRIRQKIENSLAQTYPTKKLEVIVASDCSSDGTDAIVLSFADRGVKLVRAPERKGKEHAQKHAVGAANGNILIFSDVATVLQPNALQQIVSNFRDPSIGCVSSEDRFIDQDGRVSGEGLYIRYEMFLRRLESRVNTLVGMSGSFFAARHEVCQNWAPDLQSDFNTLLNTVKAGMKGISDAHSIGYYEDIADEGKEFQRKVRTVLRGITVLMRNRQLMNPFRYGLFAWQLLSHKLCRWSVPLLLIIAFISNATLLGSGSIYAILLVAQVSLYIAAVWYIFQIKTSKAASANPHEGRNAAIHLRFLLDRIARIAYYFLSVNMAIALAWFKFLKGERATFWKPSQR